MGNLSVNNETIVNYLLGSLPEAETELLDELSITDDEFAVALNAAEKDLLDAFVQGELTDAALEKFRSHYLASPLRRGKLSFAQAFGALAEKHSTLQTVTAPDEYPAEVAPRQKRSRGFAGGSLFRAPRFAWQWGFAIATIALFIAGSWLAFENMRLRRQVSQTRARPEASGTREQELQNELERQRQAIAETEQELARVREEREQLAAELKQKAPESQVAAAEQNAANQQRPSAARGAIASFILTPQMRGVQQMPTISIPANTEQVAVQLELEPNDYSAYRVALVDQTGGRALWRSRQLKARTAVSGKALSVTFPASFLRPQVYALRVTGVAAAASEVVGEYQFRVVKQ
jgi:hypothetical protein